MLKHPHSIDKHTRAQRRWVVGRTGPCEVPVDWAGEMASAEASTAVPSSRDGSSRLLDSPQGPMHFACRLGCVDESNA